MISFARSHYTYTLEMEGIKGREDDERSGEEGRRLFEGGDYLKYFHPRRRFFEGGY